MTIDLLTLHILKSKLRDEIDYFLPGELDAITSAVERVLQGEEFYTCVHRGIVENE